VDLLRSTGGGERASQHAQPFSRTLNGSGMERRREQSEFKEVRLHQKKSKKKKCRSSKVKMHKWQGEQSEFKEVRQQKTKKNA
jgi:hypothetical protein